MKIPPTNALNCRRPTQFCERQSADDQYNWLTINTIGWRSIRPIEHNSVAFVQKIVKLFSNLITCSEDGLKNKTETSTWIPTPKPRVLLFHPVPMPWDYKSSTLPTYLRLSRVQVLINLYAKTISVSVCSTPAKQHTLYKRTHHTVRENRLVRPYIFRQLESFQYILEPCCQVGWSKQGRYPKK